MSRFPGASLPRRRPVRTLFVGMTLSRLGESLTVVSLIWIVFEETRSAGGVALAQFAYTALIPVGGLFVGAVLDRYRVVPVMVADAFLKVGVVLLAIAAALAGVGVVPAALLAALYLGLAWMVGGAGLPTLIAAAVPPAGHPRANLADALDLVDDRVRRPDRRGGAHRDQSARSPASPPARRARSPTACCSWPSRATSSRTCRRRRSARSRSPASRAGSGSCSGARSCSA